jgi:hypothetical protein
LSSELLGHVIARGHEETQGATHLVGRGKYLPDSVVNDIASTLLLLCFTYAYVPPRDLGLLVQHQLKVDRPGKNVDRRYLQKIKAAKYFAINPNAPDGEVADAVGVDRSTVNRWRNAPDFIDLVDRADSLIIPEIPKLR